jgi:AbrB family looped-hinge helix DNA binding protein
MNQVIEVSLDDLGRILIPAALRSRLGLSPGMTLVVEKGDQGGVRLRLQSEPPMLVDKGGVLVVRAKPLRDLANVTRHERDRLSPLSWPVLDGGRYLGGTLYAERTSMTTDAEACAMDNGLPHLSSPRPSGFPAERMFKPPSAFE